MCFLLNQKIFYLLLLFFCLFFGCSDNISPEQKALDLVINSHIVSKDFPVDRVLRILSEKRVMM